MKKKTKIIIGVIIGILLSCCGCLGLGALTSKDATPTEPVVLPMVEVGATIEVTATVKEIVVTLTPLPNTYTPVPTHPTITRTPKNTVTVLPLSATASATAVPATVVPPVATNAPVEAPTLAPTDVPVEPTQPPAPKNFDNNGDGRVTCSDFSTQAAAQEALIVGGYSGLDRDKDGRACQDLP